MTVLLTIALLIGVFLIGANLWTRRLTRQGIATVPQMGQIIPVNGGSIHYVEKGEPGKQTILMIHGLTGQLQHFTYALMDQLAQDYHVIAVDRPGCGYSTRDDASLGTLTEQARMIHEFMQKKGISDVVLVGHSLGGAVSLAMAQAYPDDIKALALLAPLTHRMPGPPAIFKPLEIRTEWLRNLIGNTIAVPLAKKTAPHVIHEAFAPEAAPPDFLDRAGGALGLRPSAFITGSQDVIGIEASIDGVNQGYKDLQVPGGILYGSDDPILSPAQHGVPMQQFGLSYEQLENRGHMILITAPDECAAFIRNVQDTAQTEKPKAENR